MLKVLEGKILLINTIVLMIILELIKE